MMHIQADTMDEIQRLVLQYILEKGRRVQPRGIWVQEITGASFQLLHPRARLIYSPIRAYLDVKGEGTHVYRSLHFVCCYQQQISGNGYSYHRT